jgi:hypothetical protein
MGFRLLLPELHLLPQPIVAVCKMKEKKLLMEVQGNVFI